jgi:hypothetical protein
VPFLLSYSYIRESFRENKYFCKNLSKSHVIQIFSENWCLCFGFFCQILFFYQEMVDHTQRFSFFKSLIALKVNCELDLNFPWFATQNCRKVSHQNNIFSVLFFKVCALQFNHALCKTGLRVFISWKNIKQYIFT